MLCWHIRDLPQDISKRKSTYLYNFASELTLRNQVTLDLSSTILATRRQWSTYNCSGKYFNSRNLYTHIVISEWVWTSKVHNFRLFLKITASQRMNYIRKENESRHKQEYMGRYSQLRRKNHWLSGLSTYLLWKKKKRILTVIWAKIPGSYHMGW